MKLSKLSKLSMTMTIALIIILFRLIRKKSDDIIFYRSSKVVDLPFTLPDGWETCLKNPEGPDNQITLINASISPDPPKRGSNLHISVEAVLENPITGGFLEYMVSYSGIPIFKDTLEICELLRRARDGGDDGDLEPIPTIPQCPLRNGYWKYELDIEIPYKLLPGYYGISSNGWTINNEALFCIKGSTYIAAFPPESKDTERLLANLKDKFIIASH